ncbi:hypothetical protein [Pseudomonas sp. UMAB-40]|uniref:hypothetical protein n=1 Tax=Pseudomonas sp. UMAB-40 TaxID=1365407 RepID=UPI001C5704B9|nr:hypothetical protein [Pseudomonas sp. UMAB-40]
MSEKQQMVNAISNAMETGLAFSWKKDRKVQKGVYLVYSQQCYADHIARCA